MIRLLGYIEVPEVMAANQEALQILTQQAIETGKDIGQPVGEPQVTDSDTPGMKVIVWTMD